MDKQTAERMRLQEYRRRTDQRLAELTSQPILELWMNDDDVHWLLSLKIKVQQA